MRRRLPIFTRNFPSFTPASSVRGNIGGGSTHVRITGGKGRRIGQSEAAGFCCDFGFRDCRIGSVVVEKAAACTSDCIEGSVSRGHGCSVFRCGRAIEDGSRAEGRQERRRVAEAANFKRFRYNASRRYRICLLGKI